MPDQISERVKSLIQRLTQQHNWLEKADAAKELGGMGPAAKEAVLPLCEALNHKSIAVRWFAASAIGRIGPDAAAAVPTLICALASDDEILRTMYAPWALGKIGPDAAEAVPALIAQLGPAIEYPDSAIALGEIGAAAVTAIPALCGVLRNLTICHSVRQHVASALGQIGSGGAVTTLIEALEDPHPWVREAAARALGKIGRAAKQAGPALIRTFVDDTDGSVRKVAAEALEAIHKSLQ